MMENKTFSERQLGLARWNIRPGHKTKSELRNNSVAQSLYIRYNCTVAFTTFRTLSICNSMYVWLANGKIHDSICDLAIL